MKFKFKRVNVTNNDQEHKERKARIAKNQAEYNKIEKDFSQQLKENNDFLDQVSNNPESLTEEQKRLARGEYRNEEEKEEAERKSQLYIKGAKLVSELQKDHNKSIEHEQEQININNYLSNKYVRKENFKLIRETYEDDRKCQKHPAYLNDPEMKQLKDNGFKNTTWDLFLNFVIGVKETAFYLAMSLIEGYGIIQNEFLIYLTMAIGVKLGDKQTKELVGDEVIPNQAQKLADKCIEKIKFHAAEVKNRDVSWEEIMARGKDFDYLVKKESGHSYYDSIPNQGTVMKKWSIYVEPDYNQYQQPAVPPRVNYTPPPANTTNITTSNPVNDNAVKTGGKHHEFNCDIL